MITKLTINSFRMFQNMTLYLGKYVTVIAGRNSTGKSNLLGMIANAFELKAKDGRPILGGLFRSDFSKAFKGSKSYDPTASNLYSVDYEQNGTTDTRCFRITWQRDRFRVIPYKYTEGRRTDTKMKLPVIYLGLSRLFPIGEAKDENLSVHLTRLEQEETDWFNREYKKILSLDDSIVGLSSYSIDKSGSKRGVGVSTKNYDYRTNSSGQDNVGQILLAIMSFRRLKEGSSNNWAGGVLLIDEIDATLHPSAQNRILKLLIQQGKEIGLQTVFTTHSLSLLEEVCRKTVHNRNNDDGADIEHYYLTKANRRLELKRNPSYSKTISDLMVSSLNQLRMNNVGVLTEDPEATWLIKAIIKGHEIENYLNFIDASFGCKQLTQLYEHDYQYIKDHIVVFDGDVKNELINEIPRGLQAAGRNIVKLPGTVRPESMIWDYLVNLNPDHQIWEKGELYGITWQQINDHGPESDDYSHYDAERQRYKKWFNDNQLTFEQLGLVDFWVRDNSSEANKFILHMVKAYNAIAARSFLPVIATADTATEAGV